ncbi:hypothetical protein Hdeb2414_s0016g00490371 [Helianthus debilis subsp. tardiflorus]
MKVTLGLMNSVKMFGLKAYVSLAKYDKDHKRFNFGPNTAGRNEWRPKESYQPPSNVTYGRKSGDQPPSNAKPPSHTSGGMQNGTSYADMLRGRKEMGNQGAKTLTVEGKGSLYPLHCIGRSVIGYAKDEWSLKNIRRLLEEKGLLDFGLTYVGGLTSIITFKDRANASVAVENFNSSFLKVFSKFNLWNGEDISFSRIANLSITGVPFLIRDNILFDRIGGLFGDIVSHSAFSWQEKDNSSDSVKVLTSQKSRIEESVVIKWDNKSFIIWVSEYPVKWEPSLVNELSSDSSDSDSVSGSESDKDPVDLEEDEVFEEGEIRTDEATSPVPEKNMDSPVGMNPGSRGEYGKSSEYQESLVNQRASDPNVGMDETDLHGDMEKPLHGSNSNNDGDGVLLKSNNNGGRSSLIQEEVVPGPNVPLAKDGPTPGGNLGKRNRSVLSPPSIGSTQGPAQRIFYHSQDQVNVPLDLNSPVVERYGADDGETRSGDQLREPLGDRFHSDAVIDGSSGEGVDPVRVSPNQRRFCDSEVQATIDVGSVIGINLNGFVDATESLVAEEGVYSRLQ